jgi:flagellar motor protein MotB
MQDLSTELSSEVSSELGDEAPIWPIFGDLMAGLVGVFVLILVWTLGYQAELLSNLNQEVTARQQEQQRLLALEQALAEPLATGRVTLNNGRIGISGNVLFDLNSSELQDEGLTLLQSLITPLQTYLGQREELLMISGFTDDLPIQTGNLQFADNWELSAQRALTVTRALVYQGMPSELVFAAAFGAQQPVASNADSTGRSKNRRVEIAPVPRAQER